MDVQQQTMQVGIFGDEKTLEPALEKVEDETMKSVVPGAIRGEQPLDRK